MSYFSVMIITRKVHIFVPASNIFSIKKETELTSSLFVATTTRPWRRPASWSRPSGPSLVSGPRRRESAIEDGNIMTAIRDSRKGEYNDQAALQLKHYKELLGTAPPLKGC